MAVARTSGATTSTITVNRIANLRKANCDFSSSKISQLKIQPCLSKEVVADKGSHGTRGLNSEGGQCDWRGNESCCGQQPEPGGQPEPRDDDDNYADDDNNDDDDDDDAADEDDMRVAADSSQRREASPSLKISNCKMYIFV